ncbi:DUF2125 domain-containing protein [Terasakiella sp. SH-1]|uniref:DUF2125 domain-containing protein n=1 Tax=Terasakiella sp. SH-1 TaxID=2560057 RepID=UPI001431FBA4|nr:DUF2125 domain-containing protein [Terasakiella sp. SH-1]
MTRVPHPIKPHAALTYKEPMSVRMGRWMLLGGSILLVLALLYVVAWLITSMSLRSGIQDWVEAKRAEGYLITYAGKKADIGGFPLRVEATLNDMKFAPPAVKGKKRNWVWSAKRVGFSMIPVPWEISMVTVDLSADQTLKVGNSLLAGQAEKFQLAVNWLSEGIPDNTSLMIDKWQLQGGGLGLNVRKLALSTQRQEKGDYGLALRGEAIDLPLAITGLGRRISDVTLHAKMTKNFGIDGLKQTALGRWRDAGGTLEVERMQLSYPPLTLQGNGTLALDGALQPVGAFSARIQGFFQTVSALRRAGVIRGPDASMAKVVLGMLAKQPKNGGPATISLPLTIQERALFAGPVRLIHLPQIDW